MASSVTTAKEEGHTAPAIPRPRLSSLHLSNRVSGLFKSKAKKTEAEDSQSGTESEKPVKKDLEVPLYRRYASFRSRTPSVQDGPKTPQEETANNDEMTGTAAVEVEPRAEAPEAVLAEEPTTQASETAESKPEPTATTFPTKPTDKEEKPLPEPQPSRARRLSGKVSKLLNVLPKSRNEGKEEANPGESSGRRLLDKVGHIVNRKSKALGDPKEGAAKEEGEPPALPPKSGEETAVDTQEASKPAEEAVSEEQKGELKPTTEEAKPHDPASAATKPSPITSATAKATKLARRLSARGLGNVFHHKSKADLEAPPPVSKASLLAQQLATPSNEEPKATTEAQAEPIPTAAEATTSEGTGEKTLPPPPTGEESAAATPSNTTKERAPPSSFRAAGQIARRLSTRASDLFKPKPEDKDGSEWTTVDAEEGKAGSAPPPPDSTSSPEASTAAHHAHRDRAPGLVRKISSRAQGAIAKARAKTKGDHGEAKPAGGEGDSKAVGAGGGEVKATEEGAAVGEQVAKSAEGEAAESTQVEQSTEENKQPVSSAEGGESTSAAPEIPAESSSDAQEPSSAANDATETARAAGEEKVLPTPPPSAFSIGGLGRRLTGFFGSGVDAPASQEDSATGEASKEAEEPKPVEGEASSTGIADTKEATVAEDGEQSKAPEVDGGEAKDPPPAESEGNAEPKPDSEEEKPEAKSPEAEVAVAAAAAETELKDGEAKVEPASTRYSTDKSLPSPPPSAAAASFAKVGKLSRRLSNRVGAAFRAKAVEGEKRGEDGVEVSSKAEGTRDGGAEDKPVEKGEDKAGTGEQALVAKEGAALEEAKPASEGEVKPVDDLSAQPPVLPPKDESPAPATKEDTAPPSSSAPPPAAFKRGKTKIGRRLSARVGDLFKAKSAPKEAKEGGKVEASSEVSPTPPPVPTKDAEKVKAGEVAETDKVEDDQAEKPVAAKEEEAREAQEDSKDHEDEGKQDGAKKEVDGEGVTQPEVSTSNHTDGGEAVDKGEAKAGSGEEVSAAQAVEEGQAAAEAEVKPVEESSAQPPVLPPKDQSPASETAKDATPSSSSASPPTAFKVSKTKIGRRLSARVGDLFKGRSTPKETKEGEKAEMSAEDVPAPPVPTKDAEKAHAEEAVEGAKAEDDQVEKPVVAKGEEVQEAPEESKDKKEEVEQEEPDRKEDDAKKDAEVEDVAQPEASTSTPAPETHTEKPLPSKPSRSARAKEAAADVGRQLSLRASGLMKPRPKLEDAVAGNAPSAYSSGSDKPAEGRRSRDGAPGGTLGRRLSRKVVDGIFGHGKEGSEVNPEETGKDEFVVVSKEDSEDPPVSSEAKPTGEGTTAHATETASSDLKNSSVEAVEGGVEDPEDTRKAVVHSGSGETKFDDHVKQNGIKSSPALASRVTGFLKQKLPEKILSPKDGGHSHEDVDGPGGEEKRRRKLSLGLLSKKKKEKKGDETVVAPPEVPPKETEGEKRIEKDLPVPAEGVVEAEDAGKERELPAAPVPPDTPTPADGEEVKPIEGAPLVPPTAA